MSSWGYLPCFQGLLQESPINSGKFQTQQSHQMMIERAVFCQDRIR